MTEKAETYVTVERIELTSDGIPRVFLSDGRLLDGILDIDPEFQPFGSPVVNLKILVIGGDKS